MKKYLAVLAVMIFVVGMTSTVYAATATDAVPVTATVKGSCKVTSVGAIAFGDVDAVTNATGKAATITAPDIYCTKGTSVTVSPWTRSVMS